MNIHSEDILDFSEELHAAMRQGMHWFAYDSHLEAVTARDIDVFDTKQEANAFVREKRTLGENFQELPIEAVSIEIDELIIQSLHESDAYPDVALNVLDFQSPQQIEFAYRTERLEELMDSLDWSKVFYDPLEANAEAETEEDKNAFNRLEWLLHEMKRFSETGEEAAAFVGRLVEDYWQGTPMESQIFDFQREVGESSEVGSDEGPVAGIDPDSHLLYHKDGNAFTNTLLDNFEQSEIFNHKTNRMNENNVKYLKDNLKYTGFGEALYGELEKNIQERKPEFQLHFTTEIHNKPFEATLHFRKGDNSDMYFFNSYKASIERKDGQKVEQTFQIKKGKGVNGKEAYNLLQGRSVFKDMVNKEGEAYKAWLKLNFDEKDKHGNHLVNQYHEKYGYDLKYAVNKFPVQEMDGGENQEKLLKSLERGNAQAVTIEVDGKLEKFFLEANPERKTVNVYDSHFSMMKHEDLPLNQRAEKFQQSQGQVNEPQQQALAQGERPLDQKQGRGKREQNGPKKEDSLLPKKRTRQRKGMKV